MQLHVPSKYQSYQMVEYQSNMSVEEQFISTMRAVSAVGDSPIPSRREQLSRLD